MIKLFLLSGTISGFLSVAFGAFGAHALKGNLSPALMNTFKTAVEYQFFHSIALILIAIILIIKPAANLLNVAGSSILVGMILFSGSLYILALTGSKFLGVVTPIGGVALLVGWVYFSIAVWKAF